MEAKSKRTTQSSYGDLFTAAEAELKEIDDKLAAVDAYLDENQSDRLLVKSFSLIRRAFDQMKQLKSTLGQIVDYLNKVEAQEASAQSDLDELNLVGVDIVECKERAERAVAELSASGAAKDSDIIAARNALDAILEKSKNLSIALNEAEEALSKASVEVKRFSSQRDETAASYEKLIEECHNRLAPFGINEISLDTVDDMRFDLTKRLKAWQSMNAQKLQLIQRKQDLEAEIQNLRTPSGAGENPPDSST